MSALDVLRQIKQLRRAEKKNVKIIEWGNADYIASVGIDNLTRKELRNHLEARDLDTTGTRLELVDRLRSSLTDEQLHKFAYTETLIAEDVIEADKEERGSVYVAGINDKGQLGMGDMEPRRFFTPIPSLRGVGICFVTAGQDLAFGVTHDHDVYVWGGGGVGRTGISQDRRLKGSRLKGDNWLEPQLIKEMAGEECSSVSVGSSHCMAVGRGGDCFIWGDNDAGQLGTGGFENGRMIAINNSFPPVTQVSCGANHSAVITHKGQLYLWGHGANGRLGLGMIERTGVEEKYKNFFPIPEWIRTLETVHEVSCGSDYTLARGPSGVWAWGCGSGGKLGFGDTKDRHEPTLIPALRGRTILQISASHWHALAIVQYPPMLGGGYVYSWGSGYYGQLAQGTKSVCLEPLLIEYFVHTHILIKMIAAGPHHCLAVTKEGELYSWGNNLHGALARKIDERDVTYTPIPGHVPSFGALVNRIGRGYPQSIACGRDFSVVCTYPYDGPDYVVATRLMEEARIREQEATMVALNGNIMDN